MIFLRDPRRKGKSTGGKQGKEEKENGMKDEREERMKPDRHKIMQTIEIQTNESECQVLRKGRLSEGFWCEDNLGE